MGTLARSESRLAGPRDWVWAAVLFCLALTLYLSFPTRRMYGDGSMLIRLFAARDLGDAIYIHALYLPLARWLQDLAQTLGFALDPARTLLLLSQISGAFGIAMAFLVARAFGIARRSSISAALFLMVSPPIWFFADTIEVHAPHMAAVGFVAVVTLYGPWRRPALATLLMAVCLPLLFLSHQSGLLLFPGWVLLAQVGRTRVAPPLPARLLFGAVLPVVFLSLVAAIWIAADLRELTLLESLHASASQVEGHIQSRFLFDLWNGWMKPIGLFWLPVLLGIWQFRRSDSSAIQRWALAAIIVPCLAFFISWGVPERGAYWLGTAVFFAVPAAWGIEFLLRSPRPLRQPAMATAGLAALILFQATSAWRQLSSFDVPEIAERAHQRAAAMRDAFADQPPPHVLLSLDILGQTVTAEIPEILEVSLLAIMTTALQEQSTPTDFAHEILALLDVIESAGPSTIILDRGYASYASEYPAAEPLLEALEASLERRYRILEWPCPGGGLWQLEPRIEGQPAEAQARPR